jgi:hypothetical protein
VREQQLFGHRHHPHDPRLAPEPPPPPSPNPPEPSPPPPSPPPPFPPPFATCVWKGLCIDGTTNAAGCGCASETKDISLAACEDSCKQLPECTGFAYHEIARRCKTYTAPLTRWTNEKSFLKYNCYSTSAEALNLPQTC